jgi:hypothetical protein
VGKSFEGVKLVLRTTLTRCRIVLDGALSAKKKMCRPVVYEKCVSVLFQDYDVQLTCLILTSEIDR